MTLRVVISGWLNLLTCFAFAMALVLSSPFAAHAAPGGHDGHHSHSASADKADGVTAQTCRGHGGHAMHAASGDGGAVDAESDDHLQQAGSCCQGICLSVTVPDEDRMLPRPVSAEKYSVLVTPTHSVDRSGFLRPPRHLI